MYSEALFDSYLYQTVDSRLTLILDTPDADEPEIPMYIFNIAYGAPTDGKLYKELATKGLYFIHLINKSYSFDPFY